MDEKNERAHYYLARLYLRWKKYDLANKHVKKYLTFSLSKTHSGYAHFVQGKVYSRLQMWEEAEKSFRKSYKEIKLSSAKTLAERAAEKSKSN